MRAEFAHRIVGKAGEWDKALEGTGQQPGRPLCSGGRNEWASPWSSAQDMTGLLCSSPWDFSRTNPVGSFPPAMNETSVFFS